MSLVENWQSLSLISLHKGIGARVGFLFVRSDHLPKKKYTTMKFLTVYSARVALHLKTIGRDPLTRRYLYCCGETTISECKCELKASL